VVREQTPNPAKLFHQTKLGGMHLGDALRVLDESVRPGTVDLIVTSPPFGLVRKKDYGNVDADQYVAWFRPFGELFRLVLKPTGSPVIDIGSNSFYLRFPGDRGSAKRAAA
jgi:site-specific DNA-methyltransferase (cytosine-N4-specific)